MEYTELQTKINNNEYESKLPYPKYNPNRNEYEKYQDKETIRLYREDERRLEKIFKSDLRKYFEYQLNKQLTDKQFNTIWNKAYEDGHSGGYSEILIYADNLIDVVKEFIN